jgi:hypothetical protein
MLALAEQHCVEFAGTVTSNFGLGLIARSSLGYTGAWSEVNRFIVGEKLLLVRRRLFAFAGGEEEIGSRGIAFMPMPMLSRGGENDVTTDNGVAQNGSGSGDNGVGVGGVGIRGESSTREAINGPGVSDAEVVVGGEMADGVVGPEMAVLVAEAGLWFRGLLPGVNRLSTLWLLVRNDLALLVLLKRALVASLALGASGWKFRVRGEKLERRSIGAEWKAMSIISMSSSM